MSQIWQKKEGLVTRKIAGETFIVPIVSRLESGDAIYTMNDVGAYIWGLLDGQQNTEEVASALSVEFDVTLEEAAQDTLDFCVALQGIGLLHPVMTAESNA